MKIRGIVGCIAFIAAISLLLGAANVLTHPSGEQNDSMQIESITEPPTYLLYSVSYCILEVLEISNEIYCERDWFNNGEVIRFCKGKYKVVYHTFPNGEDLVDSGQIGEIIELALPEETVPVLEKCSHIVAWLWRSDPGSVYFSQETFVPWFLPIVNGKLDLSDIEKLDTEVNVYMGLLKDVNPAIESVQKSLDKGIYAETESEVIEKAKEKKFCCSKDYLMAFPKKQLESGMTIEELEDFFESYKSLYNAWLHLVELWDEGEGRK